MSGLGVKGGVLRREEAEAHLIVLYSLSLGASHLTLIGFYNSNN